MFEDIEISDIGLILAYSITMLGTVQWIIRLSVDVSLQVNCIYILFWNIQKFVELHTNFPRFQMTSAERVLEYVELKPEENPEKNSLISLPKNWPIGGIVFDQLSFRYSSTGPWVLKNLQFSIKPNEKVIWPLSCFNMQKILSLPRSALLVEQVLVKAQSFKPFFAWLKIKVDFWSMASIQRDFPYSIWEEKYQSFHK